MRAERVAGVRLSLWRAAVGFRLVAAGLCTYVVLNWHDRYARPGVAVAGLVGILLVTAAITVLGLTGRAHRLSVVLVDAVVTAGLTLLTIPAETAHQLHGHLVTLTTVWAAGPAIETGFVTGWLGGLLAGLAQFAVSVYVRDGWDNRTLLNGLLLVIVGGVAGYLATRTRRGELALAAAVAAASAADERERLARSIHDGVLQVLGLVHRKGRAAGGEWADLAAEAATQEAALRALITRQAALSATTADSLAGALIALRSERVTVSVPADPVDLPAHDVAEIVAIGRAALQNTAEHAGPDAHAWVLLEDLGPLLCVTVRDDGVGVSAERLAAAEAEGRLGVARSIRGRAADLGGTVTIRSDGGTEIEIMLPRRSGRTLPSALHENRRRD